MSFKRVINCVETHSGEPMRVVTGGVAPLKGNSVYEQMVYLREHDDALRKFLLREPRGYPPLCCNILVLKAVTLSASIRARAMRILSALPLK